MSNFNNLYAKIKSENPYATFFTGDFNAHSQFWWPDGDSTPEGSEIEHLLTSLGLFQVISEPTNFEPNKNPSCIALVITDLPNLILDSGTRDSLDSYCHHQIVYCKVKKRMICFPWLQHLNLNTDINWQVKTFTDIFLNIMSNLIPNETKRFVPRDPSWITKPIKTLLNRKNRLCKNYKKHGYKIVDKERLDTFRVECQHAVETAELNYLKQLREQSE